MSYGFDMNLLSLFEDRVSDAIIAGANRPEELKPLEFLGSVTKRLLRESAQSIEDSELNVLREIVQLAPCSFREDESIGHSVCATGPA